MSHHVSRRCCQLWSLESVVLRRGYAGLSTHFATLQVHVPAPPGASPHARSRPQPVCFTHLTAHDTKDVSESRRHHVSSRPVHPPARAARTHKRVAFQRPRAGAAVCRRLSSYCATRASLALRPATCIRCCRGARDPGAPRGACMSGVQRRRCGDSAWLLRSLAVPVGSNDALAKRGGSRRVAHA